MIDSSKANDRVQGNSIVTGSKLLDKIPLPSLFGEGIIYVSSKRYKRILKRREAKARQKQEIAKPKKKEKRQPIHESRSKLALRRQRDKNGRYIPLPEAEEDKKNKVKCTRGRKSQKYYELMRKYEEEGNLEMIEQLKIHGTKELKNSLK